MQGIAKGVATYWEEVPAHGRTSPTKLRKFRYFKSPPSGGEKHSPTVGCSLGMFVI